MELKQVKELAARMLKVGKNRVVIKNEEEAAQAMTREDIRTLISKNAIKIAPKKGISRGRARKIAEQKKKGRRVKRGSRKGAAGARTKKKEEWMKKVRALRKKLQEIKPQLEKEDYKKLYYMIKGGYFRSKSHLMLYIKDRGLLKEKK